MGWDAVAATFAGGLDAGKAVMGYDAAKGEEAQYEFNARSDMIAADQDSAQRLANLNSTLSTINAFRTSRGLELGSPTGLAISQGVTKRAQSNIDTARLNYLTQAQSNLFGAQNASMKANAALLGGFLQTGQDAADAGASGAWG